MLTCTVAALTLGSGGKPVAVRIVYVWLKDASVAFGALLLCACGGSNSAQAPASAAVAPSISTQPANQTVSTGNTADFSVVATGTAPLSYQWQQNGMPISGATADHYTTAPTSSADNGAQFAVAVSNTAGSVISKSATLTVVAAAVGPAITTQPQSETVTVGQTATFSVIATGSAPLRYQWSKNGTPISGATAASYTISSSGSADNGSQFTVTVSNGAGSVSSQSATLTVRSAAQSIKTVFIILMENHNWSQIKGNASAPYINGTLLGIGSHAEQYYNPPGIHPSLPNYLWLEAGTNFGILNDGDPSVDHQSTTMHLATLLKDANISWKAYEESISGTSCPLTNVNQYAVRHNPFVYFYDVTSNGSTTSAYCIQHVRPFTELAADLQKDTVASYNFITPNICDDMHSCSVATGDAWLSKNLSGILNSSAYQQGGVIFITWDEGVSGDGPIGLLVISPFAKSGYENSIHYNHGSTLRTIEEIFHLTPMLGDAAKQTDLSDLFATFP